MRVVITGGPGSGKTTLISALKAAGHPVCQEAAMQIISAHCSLIGPELAARWRSEFLTAFQGLVSAVQVVQERAAASNQTIFFDRALLDGCGYCEEAHVALPSILADAMQHMPRYDRILLLELPPESQWETNCRRSETGRDDTYQQAVRLSELIAQAYRNQGYTVTPVPFKSVSERLKFIDDLIKVSVQAA